MTCPKSSRDQRKTRVVVERSDLGPRARALSFHDHTPWEGASRAVRARGATVARLT